jgi:hypothetical protein
MAGMQSSSMTTDAGWTEIEVSKRKINLLQDVFFLEFLLKKAVQI